MTSTRRHDPFVYFHSIIDNQAACDAHVVGLSNLDGDLGSAATTPNYSFITEPLQGRSRRELPKRGPGGLPAVDAFLRAVVPALRASAAYRQGGLIAIVFDEAVGDSTACCGEPPGPNTLTPGGNGPGGGATGAVLLSPFITPGTITQTPYNHYSLLRSIENLFGLSHLGFAAAGGLTPLGSDVFAAATPTPTPTPTPPPPPSASATAVCRAAHSGRALGAIKIRRHGSSAALTFTPPRRRLSFQVRSAHRPPRPAASASCERAVRSPYCCPTATAALVSSPVRAAAARPEPSTTDRPQARSPKSEVPSPQLALLGLRGTWPAPPC